VALSVAQTIPPKVSQFFSSETENPLRTDKRRMLDSVSDMPIELHLLVGRAGLEPATYGL
jgi:hypothetical protein